MAEDQNKLGLYRRVPNTGSEHPGRYDLEAISGQGALFQKPTLLCCGGITNTTRDQDGRKNANGFAKIGHGLLGLTEEEAAAQNIDIVTVLYPQGSGQLANELHSYSKQMLQDRAGTNSAFAAEFAREHLLPLVSDDSGHKLDTAIAMRQMRNVNILAMSYGAAFVQQVGNVLAQEMETLGYTPQETRDITAQAMVLSAGPVVPLAAGKASFTTVNMINFGDSEIRNLYPVIDMLKDAMAQQGMLVDMANKPVDASVSFVQKVDRSRQLPKQSLTTLPITLDCRFGPMFQYNPDSSDLVVCASQPMRTNYFGDIIQKPHIAPRMMRSDEYGKFDFDTPNVITDKTGHQPHNFFHYGFTDDNIESSQHGLMLRTASASVLANGLNNSLRNQAPAGEFEPLPAPGELLNLPKALNYKVAHEHDFTRIGEGIGYGERIAAANYARGARSL